WQRLPCLAFEDSEQRRDVGFELARLLAQRAATRGGELVEFCAAVCLGEAPPRTNEFLALEAVEGLVKRGALDRNRAAGLCAHELRDAIPVHCFPGEGAQHEDVDGAGHEVERTWHVLQ